MHIKLLVRLMSIALACVAIYWLFSVGTVINKTLLQLVSLVDYPTKKHPAVDLFTSMAVIITVNVLACFVLIFHQLKIIFSKYVIIVPKDD